MALNLGELYATITADDKRFRKGVDGADRRLDQFAADADSTLSDVADGFGEHGERAGRNLGDGIDRGARPGLKRLEKGVRGFGKAALPTLLAGAAGGALYLTAALLPAAGAITALPAAAVAAKLAMVTLSMALEGVGDALGASLTGDTEKFNEKLKELPPTTRSVVKEIGGALNGLQKSTQEAFFKPMKGAAAGLAETLRGPLRTGFADIANSLGGVGAEVLKFITAGRQVAFLEDLFAGVGSAIDGVRSGVAPLLKGLRDLIAVFIPGMGAAGQSIGDAMAKWGKWMSEISASGQAMKWFTSAKEALTSLWGTAQNVARILSGIFGAADAGNLLATIESITGEMATWVNSAEGQAQLGALFESLGMIAQALLDILPGVGGALMTVANAFNSLPGPVREGISTVLAFSVVAKGLSGVVGPLFNLIDNLGTVFGKIGPKIMPAIAWLGRMGMAALTAAGRMALAAGQFVAAAGRMALSMALTAAKVVAGWILMGVQSLIQAARMALAWIIGLGPIAWIIAAIVAIVALVIYYWDEIVAALEIAWNWVADLASDIWGGIVDFFTGVWDAIVSGIQAAWDLAVGLIRGYFELVFLIITTVLNGIVSFLQMCWDGIVAGVTAAWDFVVGLIRGYFQLMYLIISTVINTVVSVLVGAWEWIKSTAQAAWDGIVSAVSGAWDWIVSTVQGGIDQVLGFIEWLGQIPVKARVWFRQLLDAAVSKFRDLIDWAKSLPGKVLSALGNIGSKLLSAGKNLIQGLLNGMKDAWSAVKSWILNALSGIKDAVLDFFGIASPSKLFAYYGKMIGTGLAVGLQKTTGLIGKASAALNSAVSVPNADMAMSVNGNQADATVTMRMADEDRRLLTDAIAKTNQTNNFNVHAADNRYSADDLKRQYEMQVA